jgi:hypothetical protein
MALFLAFLIALGSGTLFTPVAGGGQHISQPMDGSTGGIGGG